MQSLFKNLLQSFHSAWWLGNEVDGVNDEILGLSQNQVFIPMQGKKESLNVSIAGSIAMWEVSQKL